MQRAVVDHLDNGLDDDPVDGDAIAATHEGRFLGRSERGAERIAVGLSFDDAPPEGWAEHAWFALAGDLVWAMLRLADADTRIEALEKSKRLQQALYEISDLAGRGLEMREMLARIHRVVGHLMPAENFYIVHYDDVQDSIRYLYFADSRDKFDPDPDTVYPLGEGLHSMTAALLRHGRPLVGSALGIIESLGIRHEEYAGGPLSEDWLGVPLLREGRVCGAIVVQVYDRVHCYGSEEQALLEYVGQHILTALDRKTAQVELERRVRERTQALEQANLELHSEVLERQRAEKLQQALFRITELS
ncbi:MAG: GAF domain-containing protein, partial [Xanthomonadaceae bacterium]|nr:GAF domain-containing protein [Xanthomonadaceae bacterium]